MVVRFTSTQATLSMIYERTAVFINLFHQYTDPHEITSIFLTVALNTNLKNNNNLALFQLLRVKHFQISSGIYSHMKNLSDVVLFFPD